MKGISLMSNLRWVEAGERNSVHWFREDRHQVLGKITAAKRQVVTDSQTTMDMKPNLTEN